MALKRSDPRRGLTPARTFIYAVVAIISVAAVVSINRLDTTGKASGIVLDVEGAQQTTRNPFLDQWEYTYQVRVAPSSGGFARDLRTTERLDIGDQVEVLLVEREGNRALEPVGSVRSLWWLTVAIAGLGAAVLLGSQPAIHSALGGQRLVKAVAVGAGALVLLGILWVALPVIAERTATRRVAEVDSVHVLGARSGVDLRVTAPSGVLRTMNVAASWWLSRGEPATIEVVERGGVVLVPGDDSIGGSPAAVFGFWVITLAGGVLVWAGQRNRGLRQRPAPVAG